jgi:Zn-finger nucleic acid-binding protein
MTCPRCGGALEQALDRRVAASRCGACGGVWLDATAYRRTRGAGDALSGAATIDTTPASPVATAPAVACPACNTWMRRERVPDTAVDIDVCDAHGAWFDASELRAIARARNVPWDSASETADGFIGFLGSLVDLIRTPFG